MAPAEELLSPPVVPTLPAATFGTACAQWHNPDGVLVLFSLASLVCPHAQAPHARPGRRTQNSRGDRPASRGLLRSALAASGARRGRGRAHSHLAGAGRNQGRQECQGPRADVANMGARNSDRVQRLSHLRTPVLGFFWMARCEVCRHLGALPVEQLIRAYGESAPTEGALLRLKCAACGERKVSAALMRLCDPGCSRQRG